jgi:hypothetical protein
MCEDIEHRDSTGGEDSLQLVEVPLGGGIAGRQALNRLLGVHNRRMVAAAEAQANLGVAQAG